MELNSMQPRKHKQLFDEEGNNALVDNFIKIRKNANMSQKQMAIEIGITPQHLSLIETRKIQLTSSVIFLASRVLEIEPEIFWQGIQLTSDCDPRRKIDE